MTGYTLLAVALHMQPSEIDGLDDEDFEFWLQRAKEAGEWQRTAGGSHSP